MAELLHQPSHLRRVDRAVVVQIDQLEGRAHATLELREHKLLERHRDDVGVEERVLDGGAHPVGDEEGVYGGRGRVLALLEQLLVARLRLAVQAAQHRLAHRVTANLRIQLAAHSPRAFFLPIRTRYTKQRPRGRHGESRSGATRQSCACRIDFNSNFGGDPIITGLAKRGYRGESKSIQLLTGM